MLARPGSSQDWSIIVRPGRNGLKGWIGLAKMGHWITDGDAIREPGVVLFEFGKTESDAKSKIQMQTDLFDRKNLDASRQDSVEGNEIAFSE